MNKNYLQKKLFSYLQGIGMAAISKREKGTKEFDFKLENIKKLFLSTFFCCYSEYWIFHSVDIVNLNVHVVVSIDLICCFFMPFPYNGVY